MFEKVLYATDGSHFAENALPVAIELARLSGGELRCVSVVEAADFHGVPEAAALLESETYKSMTAELERLAGDALQRAAAAARDAGVSESGIVRHGGAAEEVTSEAASWGANVIVISTHGRGGLSRLLLGSVANKIVHRAEVPVLLCRVPEGGDEE